jgi:hypothetical protein
MYVKTVPPSPAPGQQTWLSYLGIPGTPTQTLVKSHAVFSLEPKSQILPASLTILGQGIAVGDHMVTALTSIEPHSPVHSTDL